MCFHADAVAGITCKESHSPRGRGLILFGLENGVLKWDDPAVAARADIAPDVSAQ